VFVGIAHKDFKNGSLKEKEVNSKVQQKVIKEVRYEHVIKYIEYKKPILLLLLAAVLIIGIVLLVIGVFLSYYPDSVISGLNEKLNSVGLSQTDIWMYQGSLEWWTNQQITVYEPLSTFLIVVGEILTIVSAVLLVTFRRL
jgi:hypothetical protein